MLFDTHAHYDDSQFDADREEILNNLKDNKVSYVVTVGTNVETSLKSIELAEKFENVYAACGIHPDSADTATDENIDKIRKMASHKKVVAIGEAGLDYYWEDNPPKEVQKEAFIKQIELANELDMPLIIHIRESVSDTVEVLKANPLKKGIIHCVSVSSEIAEIFIKMGLYISFAGTLTFKNAPKLVKTAEVVPLDRLLVETDCPYLSPVPYRGKRNMSARVIHTAQKLGEIRGLSLEEIAEITTNNAKRIYGIEG